jgi:hypothetical protein
MKSYKLLSTIILTSVVFSVFSPSSLFSQTTGADVLFEDVKLSPTVTVDDTGTKTELKSVSHGLRKKKVFGLIPVKIYVTEFFSEHPEKLKKTNDEILTSLKLSQAVQLKLTLSRDLSGTQIADSFKEALAANKIDTEKTSKELKEVLSVINKIEKFKNTETFSISALWQKDNTATLIIQKPDGSIQKVTGPDQFVTDLFSIWFGTPVDGKMEDLKKALLK